MTNRNRIEKVFRTLGEAGFSEAYVRSLLPDWWDDQAARSPVGLSEFNLAISRNLGVDVEGLSAENPQVNFRLPHVRNFKRSAKYTESQLTPAVSVALSAARIAAQSVRVAYTPLPSAEKLRKTILASGTKYVSLRSLIFVCWRHGIPVIHVSKFDDGMPKMDGLSAVVFGRPVIVISKQTPFSAWMGFVLAHEMGHVASHHCEDDELIVDVSLSEETIEIAELDDQEREADDYAMQLLSGGYDISKLAEIEQTPEALANAAMKIQREFQIDAGHLLLKHAYQTNNWKLAIATLKGLDTENRAREDFLNAMEFELDPNAVASSSFGFLYRACGAVVFE